MELVFEVPDQRLRDYVNAYAFYEQGGSSTYNALPLGTQFMWAFVKGNLVITSPFAGSLTAEKVTLLGYFTHSFKVRQTSYTKVAGVNFKPLGVHTVFGFEMSNYQNRFHELTNDLHNSDDLLKDLQRASDISKMKTVLDEWLLFHLSKNRHDIKNMQQIVSFIESQHGNVTVEEILAQFFITERTLQRWFNKMIGVNPKLFLRINRFNHVLSHLENEDQTLQKLLDDVGYFDHSHFFKDFLSFTNCKPSVFKQLKENEISRQTIIGILKVLN